ncbi:MAG: polysulfide reductase NrfD [Gammaproteobacteria bacterium]|nr:polysulfide reductase NrfD [Gammaproteobacteria bacterium]
MNITYREIEGTSPGYYALLAVLGLFILLGLGAAMYMEHEGHHVTGMSNQIVWGMPHVFAVFLIVAASGALNVASVSSVFSKTPYKPLAPLSALLAMSLLLGGLIILVLDLGRPDRLIVAMLNYNFKSIFAWNIFLYTGFLAVTAVYLWLMMERRMNPYSKRAGLVAFVWRLILTTGTGSIFGFLVAREMYDSALLAPMFIIMSLAFGTAIYLLVLLSAYHGTGRALGDATLRRLKNLLGVFVAAVLLMVLTFHLTKLYVTQHHGVEQFILLDGGVYTVLFWGGQIVLGTLLPLALLFHPATGASRSGITAASVLVVLGGLAQMYVLIIGGQAYPMELFPGFEVQSSFADSGIAAYTPTLYEIALGLGGTALALTLVTVAIKVLRFLPLSLADADVDPHHAAAKDAA